MEKSIRFLYLPILLLGVLLTTSNCKKDETPDRDKFLGAFSVVETCGSGNDSYDVTIIESGAADNAIIFINLYNLSAQASATVDGNNITIPSQLLAGITYSGSGSISGNILTINFTVSAGGQTDNCVVVCTRK